MEDVGGYYVGKNVEETAKEESLCGISLCIWVGNTCTDRERLEEK